MALQSTIDNLSDSASNLISVLQEDKHDLDDMLNFIEQYCQEDFVAHYEDYVRLGEDYSYTAVDAFIDEFGIDALDGFEDSYQGEYESGADFAEQMCDDMGYKVPDFVVVDWDNTWETNLSYDYSFNDGFVFNKNF